MTGYEPQTLFRVSGVVVEGIAGGRCSITDLSSWPAFLN